MGAKVLDINIETISCQSQAELIAWMKKPGSEARAIVPSLPLYIPTRFQSASLSSPITILDQSKLASVLEHSSEDKVIKVEAGIKKEELDRILSQTNEWWPCHSAPGASLSEIINAGDGGTLEHGFGGPKHLVLGLDVLLADGETIKTGGRVVKNVTGYDLSKLLIGSHATLGIVLAAYLRLFAKPEQSAAFRLETDAQDKLFSLSRSLIGLGLPISTLEIISSQLFERLLSPNSQNTNSSNAVMLIELHGHAQEIEEIKSKIAEKVKESFADTSLTNLEQKHATDVFTGLAQADRATARHALEISCLPSQMDQIISFITQRIYGLYWQARPGRGRLKFLAHDLDVLSEATKALNQWAQENGQSLVVASPDHEFSLRVKTLPNQDAQAFALKLALKSKFDPANILNPLVCL
jgi:FAD/FMN-containing dehydrogenase